MGRIHDPELKPRGGDDTIMSRTHVLGLLWVTSNTAQGLQRALLTIIRLASSPNKEDRVHALNVLRHETFPQLLLSFQVLGSPEYAKIMCIYFSRLDYWCTYAPHLRVH
jgi:hypothetical protein